MHSPFPSCTAVLWTLALTAMVVAPSLRAQTDEQIAETTRLQVQALRHERESRTPEQRKIDTPLLYAARKAATGVILPGAPRLRASVRTEPDGRVKAKIIADVSPALLGVIGTLGGEVSSSFPEDRVIYALLPLRHLETLAKRADVQFIGRPPRVRVYGNARAAFQPQEVDTAVNDPEGDATHGAKAVRTQNGINGSGVKVGVISDSLNDSSNSYQTALNKGYVSTVTVIPGQSGGIQEAEGLAMLEIVHRIAPGAQLYFATGFNTEQDMARSINTMMADGCKIIIDDVGFADENPFQDETIALAVNNVTSKGVLFFSAGGNSGNKDSGMSSCWEGDFKSTANDGFLDFQAASGNPRQEKNKIISDDTVGDIELFWAEPDANVTSWYNLYEVDASGQIVQAADNDPRNTGQPAQFLSDLDPGDFLKVELQSGAARYLHLDTSGDNVTFALGTAGHARGHNAQDSANSFCVAATPASTSSDNTPDGPYPNLFNRNNSVEDFSDDGPRRMFFRPDGSAYTPGNFTSSGGKVFAKPDFTAADGVTTSVPAIGGNGNPFFGTSAAAPHAGALAALALSLNPSLTAAQLTAALRAGAVQVAKPGASNRDSGAGILLASKIIQAVANAGAPTITSAATATATVGQPFNYQITATNTPTGYGAVGLPPGLHVNGKTGLISGTPTKAGTPKLTLKATNAAGAGQKTLTLTINAG